jgi:predicted permease
MTTLLARIISLVRNLFRRERVERDLDAELRGYLEILTDEKIASGMDPVRAAREARLAVGGVEQVKEQVRAVRAGALLEQLGQDVRYALRGLRRAPVFAITTIATLALGIGANTAMFSVIDALLLRPLPVHEPERLFAVYRGPTSGAFSFPDFHALTAENAVLSGVAAWGSQSAWLRTQAGFDRLVLDTVSPNYFSLLGIVPQIGTAFVTTDDVASRGMVVISDHLWRTRFGADPAVVGRSIVLSGQSMTVIGVAPRAFIGLQPAAPTDGWITFATLSMLEPGWDFQAKQEVWIRLIARLRTDIEPRAANAALAHIVSESRASSTGAAIRLVPASTPIFDPDARSSASRLALLVAGVAALVLIIACANVANLLIVRGNARRREIGMRLAVGASRSRIARQMITESLVLASGGCLVGLVVAYWTLQLVIALAPPSAIPPGIVVALDARVIAFGSVLALVTALAFGVTPAWHLTRIDLLPVVKDAPSGEERTASGPLRVRRALVITQVALSAVLLVGAALFVRTLSAALAVPPGYDIDRVLLVSTDFSVAKLPAAEARETGKRILERVAALPGVESVAFGQIVPFSGAFVSRPALPEGQTLTRANEDQHLVPYAVVSEGYFKTLGMQLTGRDFSSGDSESAPKVIIVNDSLARKYWPGQTAVGQRLTLPLKEPGPSYEVIGVVADGKYVSLTEPQHPYVYVPWQQMHRPRMTLHVRSAGEPMALATSVRALVASVNSEVPAYNPIPLATYVDRSIAQQRIVARLLVLFGVIALAVAAVGVYGLTAFTVARRAKELAVRVALGARPRDLVRTLVAQSAVLIAAGLIAGTAATFFLSRLVEALLFGVTPADPVSFAAGAALLAVTTMAATIIPARRATTVDPLAVLRSE